MAKANRSAKRASGRTSSRPGPTPGPAPRAPLLSLVMIVKNEEAELARALDTIVGIVDEMIIVDTGSTDRTKEIAASYDERLTPINGAPAVRILDFQWCDDFAAARNFGVDAASGEWILQLDADEDLIKGGRLLRPLLGNAAIDAYSVTVTKLDPEDPNAPSLGDFSAVRLFRNRPDIRYIRPVHEHVIIADPRRKARSPVVINHLGSFKEKDRFSRNMSILRKAVEADPDDYYLWSRIGDEHFGREEYAEAAEAYRQSVRSPRDDLYFIADAMRSLAFSLYKAGDAPEAFTVIHRLEERHPAYTDAYFVEGCMLLWEGDAEGGRRLLRKCLEMGDPPPGYNTWGGTGSWRPEKALAWVMG